MIVLIDDSMIVLEMLKLGLAGENVIAFESMTSFLNSDVSRETYSVVVTDWQLPDCDDPIKSIRANCNSPIILISGTAQNELDTMLFEEPPEHRISKDAGLPAIVECIKSALRGI